MSLTPLEHVTIFNYISESLYTYYIFNVPQKYGQQCNCSIFIIIIFLFIESWIQLNQAVTDDEPICYHSNYIYRITYSYFNLTNIHI